MTTPSSDADRSSQMLAVVKRQRLQDLVFHRLTQLFSLRVLLALSGIIVSLFINS